MLPRLNVYFCWACRRQRSCRFIAHLILKQWGSIFRTQGLPYPDNCKPSIYHWTPQGNSQITKHKSPPGFLLIPCLSSAEYSMWPFHYCSTSQDLMRNQERQRTKEILPSFSESGNTSASFEKAQWLVCFLSVPLCRKPAFSAMVSMP